MGERQKQPWDADVDVTTELAASLIADQFPELTPIVIERFDSGWDNTAFLVNGALVFRFPRRELGRMTLEAETALLPKIASRLTVPVSSPTYIGDPSDRFEWLFAGYPLIRGVTADRACLTHDQRHHLVEPLAGFLRSLHAISAAEARGLGAGEDTILRMNLPKRITQAHERFDVVENLGLVTDTSPFRRILDEPMDDPVPRCLVHGDLYFRHVIIDDNGSLAGVIDWGDVHVNDPACDLMLAFLLFPPAEHARFRDAYGDIDDHTWRLARFRATAYGAILSIFGHDIGDDALIEQSLVALEMIALGPTSL